MICKECGTENNEIRKFCYKCGSQLAWVCNCGSVNSIDAIFCGECGNPGGEDKSPVPQYNIAQIKELTGGKILFNLGEEDIINQDDIDKIF